MLDQNKEKSIKLGMSFSNARAKLVRKILFDLVKKQGLDNCYRCKNKIVNFDEFTVEHKLSWFCSDEPKELFWDLTNIAFSHHKCNAGATTHSEARIAAAKLRRGENSYGCKIKDSEVLDIREELKNGIGVRETARKYNVDHTTIIAIRDLKSRV